MSSFCGIGWQLLGSFDRRTGHEWRERNWIANTIAISSAGGRDQIHQHDQSTFSWSESVVSCKRHLWPNFTGPRSIRPIENAFKHFLVYKLPLSGTWSGTKRLKLSHRGKEINCHLSQNSDHLKRKRRDARTHTLTIYTYFSTMRVTNACPGKIQEFQIRKGLLLQAEGGISWWMGGLSYVHRVRGQAHVFVFIAAWDWCDRAVFTLEPCQNSLSAWNPSSRLHQNYGNNIFRARLMFWLLLLSSWYKLSGTRVMLCTCILPRTVFWSTFGWICHQ